MVASQLEEGYATPLPSGRSFGEALLDRSVIYTGLVRALLRADVDVHYLSHITGHGLLKLMRPARDLTYRIDALPDVPEVLEFLAGQAGMSPRSAYSTFNMGAGFAVYCGPGEGARVVQLATELGLAARVAGAVEAGPRRVILAPVEVVFERGDLDLAPRRR
jgi:phosphoribosylformylglycinamidine cyclo-ligase